jgi:hypothetical protein
MNFCFFPQVDFVHAHLRQHGLFSDSPPTALDSAGRFDRTVLAANPNCLATRRAAALSQGLAYRVFEPLTEGSFARQLRDLLGFYSAIGTAYPI